MRTLLIFFLIFSVSPGYAGNKTAESKPEKKKDKVYEVLPDGYSHATFQDGDLNDFRKWVVSNIKYPIELSGASVTGKVVVSFVVDRKGSLTDIVIHRTPERLLSEEVVRVLELSPKWEPGRDDKGRKINIKYTIPVDFRLY